MNSLLEGKNILIVGAGGLLGATLVQGVLQQGAKVIAADIDVTSMESRISSLNIAPELASQLTLVSMDITLKESVAAIINSSINIDGVVNATYPRNKTYGTHFLDVTLDSFNENLALHLGGAFLLMQQCARCFIESPKEFSLVNISSIYGVVAPDFGIYGNTPMTMPVEYAAIKSALIHLNKYTSKYVNNSLFRVNSVSPGGIYDEQDSRFLNAYKKKTHGKGMLDAGDLIGAVLFLLSTQSRYVTGQNILVDDGFSL